MASLSIIRVIKTWFCSMWQSAGRSRTAGATRAIRGMGALMCSAGENGGWPWDPPVKSAGCLLKFGRRRHPTYAGWYSPLWANVSTLYHNQKSLPNMKWFNRIWFIWYRTIYIKTDVAFLNKAADFISLHLHGNYFLPILCILMHVWILPKQIPTWRIILNINIQFILVLCTIKEHIKVKAIIFIHCTFRLRLHFFNEVYTRKISIPIVTFHFILLLVLLSIQWCKYHLLYLK